jgi:hypothetical protein
MCAAGRRLMRAMPEPPNADRLLWLRPSWLAEATSWIAAELERLGLEPAGEIEQLHVRWWSTVTRVPTTEGKGLLQGERAPPHRFEAALIAMLALLRPGQVAELLAVDPDRGWLLMRHGGTRLRELVQSAADLARWEELLPRYAELQLALAPHADELLAVGVPDVRLTRLAGNLERLLEDDEAILLASSPANRRDHRLQAEPSARDHVRAAQLADQAPKPSAS